MSEPGSTRKVSKKLLDYPEDLAFTMLRNPMRYLTAVLAAALLVSSVRSDDAVPVNLLRPVAQHPHHILRAPAEEMPTRRAAPQRPTHADHKPGHWIHPPFSSHRRRVQPPPATLPGARKRQVWKSPYSYGYFGASGARYWSLHYGYRDRYTEWRLK